MTAPTRKFSRETAGLPGATSTPEVELSHGDRYTDSRLVQRLKNRETLIGSSPRAARKQGIRTRPRATTAEGSTVTFADGSALTVDAVVRATGFRLDHSFVDLPVFDDRGRAAHRRRVTHIPGLYLLGLPWQHTRGSALLGWVKDDARYIAQRIEAFARGSAAAAVPVAS